MDYFFYGTLRDADVRAAVLGRAAEGVFCRAARLVGYRCLRARGASYPVIVPAAGAVTEGLLVRGLDAADGRRLAAYEGGDYVLRPLRVRLDDGGEMIAHGFLPRQRRMASGQPWSLTDWQRSYKDAFLARLLGGSPSAAAAAGAQGAERLGAAQCSRNERSMANRNGCSR